MEYEEFPSNLKTDILEPLLDDTTISFHPSLSKSADIIPAVPTPLPRS